MTGNEPTHVNKNSSESRQQRQMFISYSRSDRLAVDQLVGNLRQRGYHLWMDVDERGIEPGEDWQRELVEQMSASAAVVACVSPDFLRSPFCRAEIQQAQAENKPIFPVIVRRLDKDQSLDEVNLSHVQFVDFTQGYQTAFRRLTLVLPRPMFPRQALKRRLAIGLGALAVSVGVFLIVMLGTGAGAFLLAPTQTLPPPTPTASLTGYDIGVVVAKFAVPEDGSVSLEKADELSLQFSNRLEPELRQALESEHGLKLTVGYLAPDVSGRVEGADSDEREDNARNIIRNYGADIVIYGLVERNATTNQYQIRPEFYVAPQSFADALEMTGSFRFGSRIAVGGSVNDEASAEIALTSRTTALVQVIVGLSNYAAQDYPAALNAFQLAAGVPDWQETQGREVLHVLLGNTQLRLANQAAFECQRDGVLEKIDIAQQEYQAAIADAPDYSRPYAGMASAKYLLALWTPEANDGCAGQLVEQDLLTEALDLIDKAQSAPDQPREIGVVSKVLFTKAQTLFFRWLYNGGALDEKQPLFQDFEAVTDQVIRNYESGDNPSVEHLVVEVYGLRGLAQHIQKNDRAAIDEFDAALNLSSIEPQRRMFFLGWKGDSYRELGLLAEAANAYTEALKIAEALKSETDIATYRDLQTQVDAALKSAVQDQ